MTENLDHAHNPMRGELVVTIGPHTIRMKFNNAAVVEFEQLTQKGVVGAFGNPSNFQFKDAYAAMLIGARQADKKTRLNMHKLNGYADKYHEEIGGVLKQVIAAFVEVVPKVSDDDDEDELATEGESGGEVVPL